MATLVQQASWGAPRYGKPHEAVGRGITTKVSAPSAKNHTAGSQSSQSMPLRSVHYGRADNRTRDELQATSVRVPKHEVERPTPSQGNRQVSTPQQGCREAISNTASLPSTPPLATRSLQGGVGSGTIATINQGQNGRVQAQAELKIKELEAEVLRVREESAAKSKLLADQAAELRDLVAQVQMQHADLLRIKAEGAQLRADLGIQQQSTGQMQQPNIDDHPEVAALQIQRAVRKWRARQHGDRAVSSEKREEWKLTLRAVEDATQLALDTILADSGSDISSVPRNTRLQLLANTLKQGVLKVNQVMMHETLQDLRRSGPLSECSRRSGPVTSMFDPVSVEA